MPKVSTCPECGCILDDPKEHSDPQRRRFFAIVREVWVNLPESLSQQYPDSEVLRKTALCRTGWCDVQTVVAGNKAAALEFAAVIRRIDRYAIVDVQGTVVMVFTARSMQKRQCPKKQFGEVSGKVLDWLSNLIGSDVAAHAGRAA